MMANLLVSFKIDTEIQTLYYTDLNILYKHFCWEGAEYHLIPKFTFSYYTGKGKYSGPIGKLIETDVWKLPVGNFKKMTRNFDLLPDEVRIQIVTIDYSAIKIRSKSIDLECQIIKLIRN